MVTYSAFETAWGWLGIAASARGLCGLTLPLGSKIAAETQIHAMFRDSHAGDESALSATIDQFREYFVGKRRSFVVTLDLPRGPAFWARSWHVAANIPYGETRSYQALAFQAGEPNAARAVGQAMAHNPLPIIIPCHRVLGSNGHLTGFGGGLEMKRRLLAMEAEVIRAGNTPFYH